MVVATAILVPSVQRGAGAHAAPCFGLFGGDQFLKNTCQIMRDLPAGIMRFQFFQIGDVADVISLSRLIAMLVNNLAPGDLFDSGNGLDNRDAVFASASQVVDLAWARVPHEFLRRADRVMTVDVVANLFAPISENCVRLAADRHPYQMR